MMPQCLMNGVVEEKLEEYYGLKENILMEMVMNYNRLLLNIERIIICK